MEKEATIRACVFKKRFVAAVTRSLSPFNSAKISRPGGGLQRARDHHRFRTAEMRRVHD